MKTVRAFLRGERWPHPDTLDKIEAGLGLDPGTIEDWIADRVDPAPAPTLTVVADTIDRGIALDEATVVQLARALLARIEALGITE